MPIELIAFILGAGVAAIAFVIVGAIIVLNGMINAQIGREDDEHP